MAKRKIGDRPVSGEAAKFYRDLSKLGCRTEFTKGDHVRIILPSGKVVFGPQTPSDWRSLRNVLAKVRREIRS